MLRGHESVPLFRGQNLSACAHETGHFKLDLRFDAAIEKAANFEVLIDGISDFVSAANVCKHFHH